MTIGRIHVVGGWLRDEKLRQFRQDPSIFSKDMDVSIEAESFDEMCDFLCADWGAEFCKVDEQFGTVKVKLAKAALWEEGMPRVIDAVWCRTDGPSSDGRRPDFVVPATTEEDLARRDFTGNAMARNIMTGKLLDPHGGEGDLAAGTLKFVGNPFERVKEDGIRSLRGLRFMVTKGLVPTANTWDAMTGMVARSMLVKTDPETKKFSVSNNRIWEELDKMFRFDTIESLNLMSKIGADMRDVIFREGIWLKASETQR